MPSLILRGLDRERYGVVKAFAELPPKAWEMVCANVGLNCRLASTFSGGDSEAFGLLADRITAFFEARKRDSV